MSITLSCIMNTVLGYILSFSSPPVLPITIYDVPKTEEAFSNRKNQMLINRSSRKTLSSENLNGLLTPPRSSNSSEGFRIN
jgi:hypothetical protein